MDFTEEQAKLLRRDKASEKVWKWIEFWYAPGVKQTKLRVEKHGQFFLSKSCVDAEVALGLSPRQYERRLQKLRAVGLLTWEVHRFNKVTTRHIRSEFLIQKYGILDPIQTHQTVVPGGAKTGVPVTENSSSTTTATTTTKPTVTTIEHDCKSKSTVVIEEEEEQESSLSEHQKISANFSAPKEGVMTHPYKGMSVDEIQAKLKGEVDPVKPIKFNGEYKASEVLRYFRKMCSIHYPELQHYSAPTAADLAQARSLSKSLSCTEVDPIAIITVLVPKWSQFRARVNTQLGYSDNFGPAVPHFGYLLKHRDIAMNCISDMQKQPPKSVPAKKAYYDGNGS